MRKPKQPSSLRCLRIFWLISCTLLLACMGCNSISRYGMDAPSPPGAATNSTGARGGCGCTPLHQMATLGLVKRVKQLLKEEGVDPNARDTEGCTPLHRAARHKHRKVAESLVTAGADLNAKDNAGYTPIHYAAACGHTAVVQLLLKAGADPKAKHLGTGHTPAACAAAYGHTAVVQLLIEKGADPNAMDKAGWTLLHWAVSQENKGPAAQQHNVVALLLAQGADVDAKDKAGWTPLHWAVSQGSDDAVQRLLQAGANPDAEDNAGLTPRHLTDAWAAKNATIHGGIQKALIEAGKKKDKAEKPAGHATAAAKSRMEKLVSHVEKSMARVCNRRSTGYQRLTNESDAFAATT